MANYETPGETIISINEHQNKISKDNKRRKVKTLFDKISLKKMKKQ